MLNKKAIIVLSSIFLLTGCSSDVEKENKTNVSNEKSSKETGEQNRLKKYSNSIENLASKRCVRVCNVCEYVKSFNKYFKNKSPSINFTEETNVDEVKRLLSNKREIVLYFLPIDRKSLAIEKAIVSLDNYLPKGVFMFSQNGKQKLHYAEIEEMKNVLPVK